MVILPSPSPPSAAKTMTTCREREKVVHVAQLKDPYQQIHLAPEGQMHHFDILYGQVTNKAQKGIRALLRFQIDTTAPHKSSSPRFCVPELEPYPRSTAPHTLRKHAAPHSLRPSEQHRHIEIERQTDKTDKTDTPCRLRYLVSHARRAYGQLPLMNERPEQAAAAPAEHVRLRAGVSHQLQRHRAAGPAARCRVHERTGPAAAAKRGPPRIAFFHHYHSAGNPAARHLRCCVWRERGWNADRGRVEG